MSVAVYYEGWPLANAALREVVAPLSPEQLALPIRTAWPLWASVAHVAGARVYWLCHVLRQPGAETTPFADPARGWEDDPERPRTAAELVDALESSWRIVEGALAEWTPESLRETARRVRGDQVQIHTRGSVLWRLITHDAFHTGEISLTLGAHGLGSTSPNGAIDLWSGLARVPLTRAGDPDPPAEPRSGA